MARIFISYSRKDQEFARRLTSSLREEGLDVWLDIDGISVGSKWSLAIQEGLDQADVMIVIISPNSMASNNVEDEWHYFIDQNKPIIPVLYEPAKIHFQLSRIQYVDFHRLEYNTAFSQLVKELTAKGISAQAGQNKKTNTATPLSPQKRPSVSSELPVSPVSLRSWRTPAFISAGLAIIATIAAIAVTLYSQPPPPTGLPPVTSITPPIPTETPPGTPGVTITPATATPLPITPTVIPTIANDTNGLLVLYVHPLVITLLAGGILGSAIFAAYRYYQWRNRPRAFISYRRKSSSMLANYIAVTLEQEHGIAVFVDTRRQDGAIDFPTRLYNAIDRNDVFVCLVADSTFEAPWVRHEIKRALESDKPMIPVLQESYREWAKAGNFNSVDKVLQEQNITEEDDRKAIYRLLQSDGVTIYDIENRFIDPAIEELGNMIRWNRREQKKRKP